MYVVTQLANKWSASLSYSQSRQLSNNSAGQQVISQLILSNNQWRQLSKYSAAQQVIIQFVKQTVKTVIQSLSWSTSDQLACQTVSQDSYLITLNLVNKWSASLSSSQSGQLSNNSAGQQVIGQFVIQSVGTVI